MNFFALYWQQYNDIKKYLEVIFILQKNIKSKNLITFNYSNIVLNGNFSNGITNWNELNSTLSTDGNKLLVTGNGTSGSVSVFQTSNIASTQNKKIFFTCKAIVTNSDCSSIVFFVRDSNGTNYTNGVLVKISPSINEEVTFNGVATMQSGLTGTLQIRAYHSYLSSIIANEKVMEFMEVMAIDLTSLYGTGNEPSANDCANIFKFVDGNTQPNFSKQIAL